MIVRWVVVKDSGKKGRTSFTVHKQQDDIGPLQRSPRDADDQLSVELASTSPGDFRRVRFTKTNYEGVSLTCNKIWLGLLQCPMILPRQVPNRLTGRNFKIARRCRMATSTLTGFALTCRKRPSAPAVGLSSIKAILRLKYY